MTVDGAQLLAWLEERGMATSSPVVGAVYTGLRERIRRGEFDVAPERPAMKVLTVRQPWAWAMFASRPKDVENRTWSTDYRGPVAILAGTAEAKEAATFPAMAELLADFGERGNTAEIGRARGALIGVVDLVDVHTSADCVHGFIPTPCSPWAMPDHFHWQLATPRPLTTPIPARGSLGLRDLSPALAALVAEEHGA